MAKGTWDELTKLINKYIQRNKSKEGVVGVFTRKQIGKFPAVGIRMTNPLSRGDLSLLAGLTRERQYFLFKTYEKDLLKDIIKVLEHVDKNNIQLGGQLLKNLEYNFNTVKALRKYNLKSEGVLRNSGKTPSKVLKDEAKAGPGEGIRSLKGSMQDLESSMNELMKLADELKPENIAKKEVAEKKLRHEAFKKKYHGRAYEGRSDQYRGLSYQLAKLPEAGIIKLDDEIYKGIKEGKYHWGGAEFHTPDVPRVWRYHFGDEIFDKFDEVFEKDVFAGGDHTFVGPNAMVDWMKKEKIKPIKVEGPKNALDYLDETELLQHIKELDEGIEMMKGPDSFWKDNPKMKFQSIVDQGENRTTLIKFLEQKYPKSHKKYVKEWKERTDKDFTPLSKVLEDQDYTVISEGDEGFKEISEKLGITARPGDNLKLEDNVIQGPWKGSSKTTAPGTYTITDHIEYIKTLEPIEAMKEANRVLKGEGRYKGLSKADQETIVNDETVTDHIFERDPDPEDFAQGGRVGYSMGSGGELEDLLKRLGMVVDGMGIYADYNQNQRKQMQRSLTNRINVLLGN